jgi:hypothetical protein
MAALKRGPGARPRRGQRPGLKRGLEAHAGVASRPG